MLPHFNIISVYSPGAGVKVAIFDTGLAEDHPHFNIISVYSPGAGVKVAIFDTGLAEDHPHFNIISVYSPGAGVKVAIFDTEDHPHFSRGPSSLQYNICLFSRCWGKSGHI